MNQPPYPYRDGDHAVLGPDITATADGETITWQGAVYRRDRGDVHCMCGGINVVHQLDGLQPAAPDTGPSVREATANDRRWWDGEKTGEQ